MALQTYGGFGFAREYGIERKWRECRLYQTAPISTNMILNFIGQNVRVKPDSLFGDEYPALVEKFDGRGLYDEDSGHAFQPYVIREVGGARICVVGQAFPRTANANPQEFFPDWSFGLREPDMIELVESIREDENPDAIVAGLELEARLRLALAELAPREAEVFCLRYFEDLSYQ